MAVVLNPNPIVRLAPTPILKARLYSLGDFMRAFGADESAIRKAQDGFAEGVFSGVTVKGRDYADMVIAQTSFDFDDIVRDGTIDLDLGSDVSVTGQLSKRLEFAIIHAVNEMRRRGLRITYGYTLTPKGSADQATVFARYGLVSASSDQNAPGLRTVFTITEKRIGGTLTHASSW